MSAESSNIRTHFTQNRIKQSRNWCFTVDNWTLGDLGSQAEGFKALPGLKGICFQYEEGEQGMKHLQCFVSFNSSINWTTCMNRIKNALLEGYPNNLREARNVVAAYQYCKKEASRIAGPIEIGSLPSTRKRKVETRVIVTDLFTYPCSEWQQFIIDLYVSTPSNRLVYWFYDKDGCTGKTVLARHLYLKYNDVLYVNGKASDMKCAVAKHCENGGSMHMLICNIPRTQSEVGLDSLINGLEQLKDAIFFSGKYESGMCCIEYFHMVVLANIPPPVDSLSTDRWYIREIRGHQMFARPNVGGGIYQ